MDENVFTKNISDVERIRLPHIPEKVILEFIVAEDLNEVDKIKVLL